MDLSALLRAIIPQGGACVGEMPWSGPTPYYAWLYTDNLIRIIDWSRAGVWLDGVKGIPDFPVDVTLTSEDIDCTGSEDATAIINAALAACSAYHAVLLPAGDIRIDGVLAPTKDGVVLRGDGPGLTVLHKYNAGNCFHVAGTLAPAVFNQDLYYDILSGYTRGSNQVVLSSDPGTDIQIGDVIRIDQLNDDLDTSTQDPAYWAAHVAEYLVSNLQPDGSRCTWVGRYGVSGTRGLGENLIVTAKSGATITFHRPLWFTYSAALSPQCGAQCRPARQHCGIENLTIECESTNTSGYPVHFYAANYCWVNKVEIINVADRAVFGEFATIGCEVRRVYPHGAQFYDGSRGYGISPEVMAYEWLVEDNILDDLHAPIIVDGGGGGNVIGYNYARNSHVYGSDTWFIQHIGSHACHEFYNLYEGNIVGMIMFDSYHGSGSHQMAFRNWLLCRNEGRAGTTQNYHAAVVEANNKYASFIGNVLGESGYSGALEVYPFTPSEYDIAPGTLWKIGYDGYQGAGALDFSQNYPPDALTYSSILRQGNYNYVTLVVDGTAGRDIPPSLYLAEKPAFFGSLPWPGIGPDVIGLNQNNPARRRWNNYVTSGVLADLFADEA